MISNQKRRKEKTHLEGGTKDRDTKLKWEKIKKDHLLTQQGEKAEVMS